MPGFGEYGGVRQMVRRDGRDCRVMVLEQVVLPLVLAAVLVLLAFLAVNTRIGSGSGGSSPPDLTGAAGALFALLLGAVINPRSHDYWGFRTLVWAVLLVGALGVAVLATVHVFDNRHHAAGVALTAALVAFGGLLIDGSKLMHPQKMSGQPDTHPRNTSHETSPATGEPHQASNPVSAESNGSLSS